MKPFLLLLSMAVQTGGVQVDIPVPTLVSEIEVQAFTTSAGRDAGPWPDSPPVGVSSPGGALPAGRLDLLEPFRGGWRWIASLEWDGDSPVSLPSGAGWALLYRTSVWPGRWAWGTEADLVGRKVLKLWWFRTVSVTSAASDAEVALFVPGREDALRPSGQSRPSVFPFVPPGPALACSFSSAGDSCEVVSPDEKSASLGAGVSGPIRVFRSAEPFVAELREPGLSLAVPRTVAFRSTAVGEWTAVAIAHEKNWAEMSLDALFASGGRRRLDGFDVEVPPGTTAIDSVPNSGVAVRPLLLPERREVLEAEARLVLLPVVSHTRLPVPVAICKPDVEGVFQAPGIPAGRNRLRLLSSLAGDRDVEATLEAGEIADVVFAPGLVATGTLVARGTARPAGRGSVQVLRIPADLVVSSPTFQGFEILDWVRETVAEANGAFSVALPGPGRYRFLALWGETRGSLELAVPSGIDRQALGEVPVSAGTRLRGFLGGCATGELLLIPLPRLEGGVRPGFFEFRRVSTGLSGEFDAAGFAAGTWLVGATCAGSLASVSPGVLELPEEGDVILKLEAVLEVAAATAGP